MEQLGFNLSSFVEHANQLRQVRKSDLRPGDQLLVITVNSLYSISPDQNGSYLVSGGWFDRHGLSPVRIAIAGCSLGGCMIKLDILAACGLCLEFGNRVITSAIQKIILISSSEEEPLKN